MIVSSPQVKKFLYDVLQQTNFPGNMAEFVVAVKAEVAAATFDPPKEVAEPKAKVGQ